MQLVDGMVLGKRASVNDIDGAPGKMILGCGRVSSRGGTAIELSAGWIIGVMRHLRRGEGRGHGALS